MNKLVLTLLLLLLIISIKTRGQGLDAIDSLILAESIMLENALGMESMDKSTIDLRIHLDPVDSDTGLVVWIYQVKEQWKAVQYRYRIKGDNVSPVRGKLYKRILSNNKINLTPASGWATLWSKLLSFNILTLPSKDELYKTGKLMVDSRLGGKVELRFFRGSGYVLRVKQNGATRFYTFDNPKAYAERIPNVEEIQNYKSIIEEIETEFKINLTK
jgi:hypothetical protein